MSSVETARRADMLQGADEWWCLFRVPWRASGGIVITKKWHTVAEVADMLGYGMTKTRMFIITGELRSLKDGGAEGAK